MEYSTTQISSTGQVSKPCTSFDITLRITVSDTYYSSCIPNLVLQLRNGVRFCNKNITLEVDPQPTNTSILVRKTISSCTGIIGQAIEQAIGQAIEQVLQSVLDYTSLFFHLPWPFTYITK